jgi:hypothetical protein
LLGVLARVRQVELIQHQARSLQLLVMAGDTISIKNGTLRSQRGLGQRGKLNHGGHQKHFSAAVHVLFGINKVLGSQGGRRLCRAFEHDLTSALSPDRISLI